VSELVASGGRRAARVVRDERLRGGNLVHDHVVVGPLDGPLDLGRLVAGLDDEAVVLRSDPLVHLERNLHSLAAAALFAALAQEVGAFRRPGFGSLPELGDALVDLAKERLVSGLAFEAFRDVHFTLLARTSSVGYRGGPASYARQVTTCPSCGAENPEGFRFCGSCGAGLAEAPPPREVRKTVTVLFCDVVGSTALGERVDPEPLRRLMGSYFEQMRAIVERHGGTVEKFIGDAVMAVFGVPQSHEDDALRAVRAAAEMHAAAGPLELGIRIGINTGEVVTGEGETLVTGDAVNVAARLEQAASPGETLIGGATLQLVRDAVETEATEPLELKGKAELLQAHRVFAIDPDAPSVARRLDRPMVGRTRELERLLGDFEHSANERACHMFTLLGAAGVGKSRLVRAFLDNVGARARVLRGRCLPYGEGITYWPVVEVLLQLGSEPESVIGGSPAEAQLSFRKLLEGAAVERPLVVYFDDLQWAEPTFLDLVEHIADWSRDAPIFLLCAARPDLLDLRATWGGGKLNAVSLLLESLSAEDSALLVGELLEEIELDAPMRTRIVDAAEGNPLFVEEMVAMVREDGADGEMIVPPTIHALLQARLDRLGGDERTVIERGAVEGKIFHRGAVLELAPEPVRAGVGTHLLALVRKELIRPDRTEVPGDDAFRFRHLLIRDAAYESVPKETRAALHEQFVAWLDSHAHLVEQDEIAGYHLEQAARYREEIGSSNEKVAEQAFRRLAKAGQAALGRSDWSAARSLLRRAVALVPRGHGARADVLPDYYLTLVESAEWDAAEAAVAELKASPDEVAQAFAALFRAELDVVTEREVGFSPAFGEAVAAAVERFERLEDPKGLAYASRLAALERWASLRWVEAIEKFEVAAANASRAGIQYLEDDARSRIARAYAMGPAPLTETIERLEQFIRDHADRPLALGGIRGALARVLASRGEIEAARAIPQAEEMYLEAGMHVEATSAQYTQTWIAHCAGDFEEEARLLRRMVERQEELKDRNYLSTGWMQLGTCLATLGRNEEAQQALERSRVLTIPEDVVDVIGLDALEAVLRARRGELEEGQELARRALARAEETDHVGMRLDARWSAAEVFERAGRGDEAKALLEESVEIAERHGHLVAAKRARERLKEAFT
jgi:class 3 adenylate cyclase/tetratricopeptide (TPR) repeat protein